MTMVAILPAAEANAPAVLTPADVARRSLIVTQQRSNHAQLAREWLKAAGLDVRPAMEIDNVAAIKEVVAVGLGMALVPRESVTNGATAAGLVVRPLDPPLALPLGLIRRRNTPDDPALRIVEDAILALKDSDMRAAETPRRRRRPRPAA